MYPQRCVADGSVGLPVIGDDVILLAALEVARAGLPVERVILEVDDARVAVGCGKVVVEGREFRDGAAEVGLADPPVEVDDLRFVFLDEFGIAREPVARPGVADVCPVVVESVGIAAVRRTIDAPGRRAKRTSDR